MYQEDYISTFNIEDYENALNNNEILLKLEKAWLNKYAPPMDPSIDVIDVLFKESLDHYVLKKLNKMMHI